MMRALKYAGGLIALFALVSFPCGTTTAGTIIRLGMGSDASPDIEFDGTTLSTVDDGVGATTEDQNTNVDYQGFMAAHAADIPASVASVSLNGLVAAPPVTVAALGTLVIANFNGGTLILRDAANLELLSGTLGGSSIAGTIGGTGTGGLFTTTFSTVNPTGSLAQYVKKNSLTLSMSFTDVKSNGVSGFALQLADPTKLAAFTGDVTMNIGADPIPEPASVIVLLAATFVAGATLRRRCW